MWSRKKKTNPFDDFDPNSKLGKIFESGSTSDTSSDKAPGENKLSVTKLPDNSFALENVVLHNPTDFPGLEDQIYLNCNGTVYRSLSNATIPKGMLGVGNAQRMHHRFPLNALIDIHVVEIDDKTTNKLTIKLSRRKKKNDILTIHVDDFKRYLAKKFKKHYFSHNQKLLFDHYQSGLVGQVFHSDGFINSDTDVNIITDDLALNVIDSSIMSRDLFKEDFNFEEIGIGGLNNELANILRRALSSRAIRPSIVEKLGIKHVKGIILHGPPGTGKTLIARNIGKLLSNNPPTIINGPEILNKYVGQSEENLRKIFSRARADYDTNGDKAELHIFIFDEIDAICKKRGRGGTQSGVNDSLVNQLLTLMDGVESLPNIFLISMTNRIDLIDEALLRPGRIEIKVRIGLPDEDGRVQIFRIHTDKMKNNSMMGDVDLLDLSRHTENFSGAEIESVVKNATSFAVNELLVTDKKDINEEDIVVEQGHFEKALSEVKPAFGNNKSSIRNLLPPDFEFTFEKNKSIFDEIRQDLEEPVRLRTILLQGHPRTGKSSIVTKVALGSEIKYVKLVRPINVIRMDENGKSFYLTDVAMDAYESESSLIIFDDIEVLTNFADLGYNLSFSNKLYQTLLTILKTLPENPKNNLTIICTTASQKLADLFGKTFDKVLSL